MTATNCRTVLLLCALSVAACASVPGASGPGAATVSAPEDSDWDKTLDGLDARSGLLDVHVDTEDGKVVLELPAPDAEGRVERYLYLEGLTSGLGSNPIGLDRGQLGKSRIVDIRRIGNKVLIEEPNLRYRALTDNPAEARATEQAFATSVLWAAEAAAVGDDGRALVDITSFLVRDAHGVSRSLATAGQGSYRLDEDRSMVDPAACLAFPDNLEFEAILTYGGEPEGAFVRETTPTADSVTLIQHHSLVRLPDDGYRSRPFDPRMGSFAVSFMDYAAPLGAPIEQQWIVRHRLERTDPAAASSPAEEPIVYYVDSGAPEPIRSALVEGASWWNEAFEAAGFEDAFRVEILPENAHPLDVRYNVIQWVHRSTRGWSYGGGVVDPRTGEMIKGHVSLGSLRVRQDILLFEGLVGAEATGRGGAGDPIEAALARIRQLSAHEVGHTLGFNHNFAASTYGRASVMDYPAPWIRVTDDGDLDLSEAYAVGVGAWDRHATDYAYRDFSDRTDERAALAAIVERGVEAGLLYQTDADARPPGAAHPAAGLWDNGSDSVAALAETLEVRRIALERFGEGNLAAGRPLALLEEVLAPLYFHHRYQLEVTAKMIGGVDYRYKLAGDGQPLPAPVAPERQRAALAVVLRGLDPATLAVPENVLSVMHPRDSGSSENRELFDDRTAPLFDAVGAAATAADMAVDALTVPARLNRVAHYHALDAEMPSVKEVLEAVVATAFESSGAPLPVTAAVQEVVVAALIELAQSESASLVVRAATERTLEQLAGAGIAAVAPTLRRTIEQWLDRPAPSRTPTIPAPDPPPGPPIGSASPLPESGCTFESVKRSGQ